MTTYTLTEEQRQQLLDVSLAGVSKANTLATKMLQSLTPNSGEVAAPSTSPIPQEKATALAHRIATTYTHRSAPGYSSYAFVPHTLMDFVRAIERNHNIKGGA